MVRAVIRGKLDLESETAKVVLLVSGAPQTGGRSRTRIRNEWGDVQEAIDELGAFLDENLPENVPAP